MSYGHSGTKYCDACYCNELDEAIAERDRLTQELLAAIKGREEARALLARLASAFGAHESYLRCDAWAANDGALLDEARAFLAGGRHSSEYDPARDEARGAWNTCPICGQQYGATHDYCPGAQP